jgi:hypothetical protein
VVVVDHNRFPFRLGAAVFTFRLGAAAARGRWRVAGTPGEDRARVSFDLPELDAGLRRGYRPDHSHAALLGSGQSRVSASVAMSICAGPDTSSSQSV